MDEYKYSEHEKTEEDAEVQLTDLPLLSDAGGKRSLWLARLLLGWQGSFRQWHWPLIGALATLLLTVLAALVILSPLQWSLTPSSVHPGLSSNPSIVTYRSHPLLIYRGHSGAVRGMTWSPDGTRIASGGEDGTVQVWNATTGERILTYRLYADALHSVAWSPDGARIASTGRDNSVHVWDATTGKLLLTYRGHAGSVGPVAWSPDGKRIASGSSDGRLELWDAATGKHILTYRGHTQFLFPAVDAPLSVLSISWPPNGKRIASGSSGDTVQVWDAATGKGILTYKYHFTAVYDVAWSPDGTRIASSGQMVRVWDATTGRDSLTYEAHTDTVWAVAWSPDGKFIASGSSDGTIQVWDASTGKRVLTFPSSAFSVAWSPDGKRIVSGGEGGSVGVWQVV